MFILILNSNFSDQSCLIHVCVHLILMNDTDFLTAKSVGFCSNIVHAKVLASGHRHAHADSDGGFPYSCS